MDRNAMPAHVPADMPTRDRKRYRCPGCGKRRRLREEYNLDTGVVWFSAYVAPISIDARNDDGVYCWRCVLTRKGADMRDMTFNRLWRCPDCCAHGSLRRGFYTDERGAVHLSLDCFIEYIWHGRDNETERPAEYGPAPVDTAPNAAANPPSVTVTPTNPPPVTPTARPERAAPVTAAVTALTRNCEHCDELFEPARADTRYCSARCRVAAHRAKQRSTA